MNKLTSTEKWEGERVCSSLGFKAAFNLTKTIRQTVMKVKTCIPEERRMAVVYEVPRKDCNKTYIGETKRTMKFRLGERTQAVKERRPKGWYCCSRSWVPPHTRLCWCHGLEKCQWKLTMKNSRGHPHENEQGDNALGQQSAATNCMEPHT